MSRPGVMKLRSCPGACSLCLRVVRAHYPQRKPQVPVRLTVDCSPVQSEQIGLGRRHQFLPLTAFASVELRIGTEADIDIAIRREGT